MNFERYEGETKTEYLLRLVGYKLDDKSKDIDWQDIVDFCGLEVHRDVLRKAMQPSDFGAYAIYKYMLENDIEDSDILTKLEEKHLEVKKDIQKLRDLRTGENERIRNQARKEAILEEIRYYLKDIKPYDIPDYKELKQGSTKMIGAIADAHFGKELCIEGLEGDKLNVYNEFVFYERTENLFNEYVQIINEEGISKLYFADLSDGVEGLLRNTALQYVKYGITESAIKYGNYMASWLNKLSEYVEIDYYGCKGNHMEYRILNGKSGDFGKENAQYIIDEIIRLSLINNKRVKVNPTKGLQYIDVDGYKVLATHGQEEKNLINSVKEYKEIYDVKIDLMISGHLHNSRQETVSLHSKVVQFPSLIGIDDFSMKLKKTAKAEGKAILIKGKRFINIDIEL